MVSPTRTPLTAVGFNVLVLTRVSAGAEFSGWVSSSTAAMGLPPGAVPVNVAVFVITSAGEATPSAPRSSDPDLASEMAGDWMTSTQQGSCVGCRQRRTLVERAELLGPEPCSRGDVVWVDVDRYGGNERPRPGAAVLTPYRTDTVDEAVCRGVGCECFRLSLDACDDVRSRIRGAVLSLRRQRDPIRWSRQGHKGSVGLNAHVVAGAIPDSQCVADDVTRIGDTFPPSSIWTVTVTQSVAVCLWGRARPAKDLR
jgi:hypothetical protein